MSRPLKVIITMGRLEIGGAELRTLQLLEEICRRGHDVGVTLYVVSGKPGSLDQRFRQSGVDIVWGSKSLLGLFRLMRLCHAIRPDVLHINAEAAAGLFGMAGVFARVPVRIAHFRSMPCATGFVMRAKAGVYELLTTVFCNRHIGVSETTRHGRWLWRPWLTVYNGIAPSVPEGRTEMPEGAGTSPHPPAISSTSVNVLVLGRLTATKNLSRAITAFAAYHARHEGACLHIVGPVDPLYQAAWDDLYARARASGLPIHQHGQTVEPRAWLERAAVLLLPSRLEGLPGVVLEALSVGTPVVASALPGVAEIAARVEGVLQVPADAGDGTWADALSGALRLPRDRIAASFRTGPFGLTRHTDTIVALWRGEA